MTVFTPAAGAVHDRSDTVPVWLKNLSLPDPSMGEYRLQPLGNGYTYEELTFIRRILPCKSPEAYARAELRVLQSSGPGQTFSPYGACGR